MYALARVLQPLFPTKDLLTLCESGASISILRSFHYHANSANFPDATGSVAHTDWGFATLVAQEEGSCALQCLVNEEWRSIIARCDTLIVNCSDFLTLLSYGRFHNPIHRVILTDRERFSFVYFQYPPFDEKFPSLTDMPLNVINTVSLLKNQTAGGSGRLSISTADGVIPSFGRFISGKWAQVARHTS